MKEKSRRMTLMMKLGGGTALLVVLVTVLCVGAAVMIFTGFLENDARQKAELAVDGLENILTSKKDETRAVTLFLARYGSIAGDVVSGDTAALIEKLTPMWKETDLDFVTVLDARGNVLARLHEPDKKGDSLANQANVRGALAGQVTTVVEPGTQIPLSARTGVPVKDASGKTVASTRATVPTSDDINCAKCHGTDAFNDILVKHDDENGTTLLQSKPVLCAECHGSLALGKEGRGTSGKYFSEAIHGSHSDRGASCYDCHPGNTTKCNRSAKHTAADGNCARCHGTMTEVSESTKAGRVPWADEPSCSSCHTGVTDVGYVSELYRTSSGHGNMMCSACHGSPHAMVPSLKDVDNYQAMQYQPYSKSPKSLGSCGACHGSSRGEDDLEEYSEVHGGSKPEKENGCFICHTSVETDIGRWPHSFTWKNSN